MVLRPAPPLQTVEEHWPFKRVMESPLNSLTLSESLGPLSNHIIITGDMSSESQGRLVCNCSKPRSVEENPTVILYCPQWAAHYSFEKRDPHYTYYLRSEHRTRPCSREERDHKTLRFRLMASWVAAAWFLTPADTQIGILEKQLSISKK